MSEGHLKAFSYQCGGYLYSQETQVLGVIYPSDSSLTMHLRDVLVEAVPIVELAETPSLGPNE